MTIRSYLFIISLISMLLVSPGISAQSNIAKDNVNQYLPGELNELALESLRVNDFNSAKIFIERAYRLNPLSPDINENMAIIRSLGDSKSAYRITKDRAPDPLADSAQAVVNADAPLPPLWPKK